MLVRDVLVTAVFGDKGLQPLVIERLPPPVDPVQLGCLGARRLVAEISHLEHCLVFCKQSGLRRVRGS